MRTKLYIFILIVLLSVNFTERAAAQLTIKGQDYIPMLDTASNWDIAEVGMGGFCWASYPKRYFIKGDTVFNSTSYKVVYYYNTYNEQSPPYCPPFYIDTVAHQEYFYMREDLEEGRVYKYDPIEDEEWLLFDFTMQAGDTLEDFGMIIDTVYYITTPDSLTRKVLNLDYLMGDEYSIIEGIGGNCGPFEMPCTWFESWYNPLCFKRNGKNLFYNYCNEIITVNTYELAPIEIKYYPNPVVDLLTIEIPFQNLSYKINIANALGMKVYSSSGYGNITINFADQRKGTYIATLLNNDRSYHFIILK